MAINREGNAMMANLALSSKQRIDRHMRHGAIQNSRRDPTAYGDQRKLPRMVQAGQPRVRNEGGGYIVNDRHIGVIRDAR